jgi:hypothetical protein
MHLSKMKYCQNLVATIPIVALGVSLHNSFTPVPIILLRDKFALVKVQWPPYGKQHLPCSYKPTLLQADLKFYLTMHES